MQKMEMWLAKNGGLTAKMMQHPLHCSICFPVKHIGVLVRLNVQQWMHLNAVHFWGKPLFEQVKIGCFCCDYQLKNRLTGWKCEIFLGGASKIGHVALPPAQEIKGFIGHSTCHGVAARNMLPTATGWILISSLPNLWWISNINPKMNSL